MSGQSSESKQLSTHRHSLLRCSSRPATYQCWLLVGKLHRSLWNTVACDLAVEAHVFGLVRVFLFQPKLHWFGDLFTVRTSGLAYWLASLDTARPTNAPDQKLGPSQHCEFVGKGLCCCKTWTPFICKSSGGKNVIDPHMQTPKSFQGLHGFQIVSRQLFIRK